MGLNTWIRNNATHKATGQILGSSYNLLSGPASSGRTVTERSAMQMTAVYSCVWILAEAIRGLPLYAYWVCVDGGEEKVPDHPLYRSLHDKPSSEITSFVLRETLMTYLLLRGNAYAQVTHNRRGEVIGLYPLMPNHMTVGCDSADRLYYEYQRVTDEPPNVRYGWVILLSSEVLYIPDLSLDGLVEHSPAVVVTDVISMTQAYEDYGGSSFANSAVPRGVLGPPDAISDPTGVHESWTQTFGEVRNGNKIVVLEEGMKYTPISVEGSRFFGPFAVRGLF